MRVTVKNVVDKSFDGNDGAKVLGADLLFEYEGKIQSLSTWIPPVATAALQWKPGDEVEIEEYTDKNGKPKFKTPQPKGPGGGGFRGRSVSEQLELDRFHEASTNARTALMQAVTLAEKADSHADLGTVLIDAAHIYDWLQSRSPESSTQASTRGDSGHEGGGVRSASSAPTPSHASGAAPPEVSAAGVSGNGEVLRSPVAGCTHPTWAEAPNAEAAARGIKVCVDCGKAEKRP